MASALAVPGVLTLSRGAPSVREPRRTGNAGVSSSFLHGIRLGRYSNSTGSLGTRNREKRLKCRAGAGLEDIAPLTAAVYGLTLMSGGLVAYSRTGSKGSLAGGLTGGLAFAVAFILMLNPETRDIANAIGFGAAFLFIAVFGIRLAATRKPLPSGLLLAISIGASVVFVNAYFTARLP